MNTKCKFAWLVTLAGTLLFSVGANANSLQKISYSSLSADRTQVRLHMSDPITGEPLSFTVDTPARLAVDFRDTRVEVPARYVDVGVGVVASVTVAESGGRARVVLNLAQVTPYETVIDGNDFVITVGAPSTGSFLADQRRANDFQPTAVVSSGVAAGAARSIRNIDFRRTPDGAGRVIVSLSDPATPVAVREEGGNIVVDITGAKLPDELLQRLDVVDFATPVQFVDPSVVGDNTQIRITAQGAYDHLAYQADDEFAVEFRELTPEEKERIDREKFVYTGERLSLNFQDIEVRSVLQLLADFTDINMVTSDTVGGNITLRLKNVPWDQALDIILRTKGLDKRVQENVILVAPQEELAAREQAQLEADRKVETLAPLRSEFIQINYAKAEDIADLLKGGGDTGGTNRLLSPRGSVSIDERTNTLLLKDTADTLESVRRIVKRLDIPVRQVQIESRIVIASDDFSRDLGVRLSVAGGKFDSSGSRYAVGGGALTGDLVIGPQQPPFVTTDGGPDGAEALAVNLPAAGATSGVNFVVGSFLDWLLRLELTAMQSEGRGEIISSPRVVTSDQGKALIKQGFEIPYQEATSSGATSVSFKEAVLKLEVTPQITPDDRIIMELNVSQDTPDFSRVVLGVPPINTREVETNVLVDDGDTVVLGGIFERVRANNVDKVPFFGDLPTVGRLFRKEFKQDDNTELLIFVTPRIMRESLSVGL
ncbi:MAG: type IV pilus secretin PilQ [Chromatiales bacterium]|nr:type IV pilus secretin PilQ [Chromatiales bacterium]